MTDCFRWRNCQKHNELHQITLKKKTKSNQFRWDTCWFENYNLFCWFLSRHFATFIFSGVSLFFNYLAQYSQCWFKRFFSSYIWTRYERADLGERKQWISIACVLCVIVFVYVFERFQLYAGVCVPVYDCVSVMSGHFLWWVLAVMLCVCELFNCMVNHANRLNYRLTWENNTFNSFFCFIYFLFLTFSCQFLTQNRRINCISLQYWHRKCRRSNYIRILNGGE